METEVIGRSQDMFKGRTDRTLIHWMWKARTEDSGWLLGLGLEQLGGQRCHLLKWGSQGEEPVYRRVRNFVGPVKFENSYEISHGRAWSSGRRWD